MVRVAWWWAGRVAFVVAAGAALMTGVLVGPSVAHAGPGMKASHVVADPCPCTLPQCRTVCSQN